MSDMLHGDDRSWRLADGRRLLLPEGRTAQTASILRRSGGTSLPYCELVFSNAFRSAAAAARQVQLAVITLEQIQLCYSMHLDDAVRWRDPFPDTMLSPPCCLQPAVNLHISPQHVLAACRRCRAPCPFLSLSIDADAHAEPTP
jgi:hypothetical protein